MIPETLPYVLSILAFLIGLVASVVANLAWQKAKESVRQRRSLPDDIKDLQETIEELEAKRSRTQEMVEEYKDYFDKLMMPESSGATERQQYQRDMEVFIEQANIINQEYEDQINMYKSILHKRMELQ